MSRVLVIDDDASLCRSLQIQLQASSHTVETALNAKDGIEKAESFHPDMIFLDLRLPDQHGLDCLKKFREKDPGLQVVIITGYQDMKATIEAMRLGAFDYIRKPFEIEEIMLLMEKARLMEEKRKTESSRYVRPAQHGEPYEIIGSDRKIIEVVKQIGLLSRSRVNVLIQGESGTGKELVARALHETRSPVNPFLPINCSAVVPTLLESELFGHEKGAFTGANTRKTGKLEHAGKGTVFLDEIGDMPMGLQAKILRVLQERIFERVGGLEEIPFEACVISATNQNLENLVEEGKFREDLYYRLAVSCINISPLRERREDIPLLVQYLISRIARRIHSSAEGIEQKALKLLKQYDWPGNVRELENVLTRAIALAKSNVLTAEDFEFSFHQANKSGKEKPSVAPLREAEKEHIHSALASTGWNITKTARLLEISPTTLRKKIKDYHIKEA